MKYEDMKCEQALKLLSKKRPVTGPNQGIDWSVVRETG